MVNPLLNDKTLYHKIKERYNLGKFQTAIGSTTVSEHKYLADDIDASECMVCDNPKEELDDTTLLDIHHTYSNK